MGDSSPLWLLTDSTVLEEVATADLFRIIALDVEDVNRTDWDVVGSKLVGEEEVAAGYDAPADDAYGAPAEEYGAPADDAYGAPAEASGDDYDYEASGVPLDAYAATEAAPTYEDARRGRARGGFGRSAARSSGRKAARGGRARTFGRANRRPAPARKAPRAGRNQRPAPRRQQEQRRGRGLIPIPIPHRGPRRNAIAFRHQG